MAKTLKQLVADEKPQVVAKAKKKTEKIVKEVVKKPTVKELKEQVASLTAKLDEANLLAVEAMTTCDIRTAELLEARNEVESLRRSYISELQNNIELEDMSIWEFIKYKFKKED